ncbi:MAG: WecB/TagA/CpsF family glycosyltransferase [Chitinophagaceae bacterium]
MTAGKYKTTRVLGYEVYTSSLKDIPDNVNKILLNTFSPNTFGLAKNDSKLETALKNTDLLVLDGMGVAVGSLLINGRNIKKIAGQDCFDYFMDQASKNGWKVFFLGSTNATLEKIARRAGVEYPGAIIGSYSPPFKHEFSEEENKAMVQHINDFIPEVLFVGMTAPKQEKWAYYHKDEVNARIISTIGNVFDWYAGNSSRPAKIWIKLRLEWFVRIFHRPELFRRNTGNQLVFLKDVFLHILFIKRIK